MTIDYSSSLPPFLRRGELADLPPSSNPSSRVFGRVRSMDIDTEEKEFYLIWLPFTYGLDSEPI
jgi:hypothetical protein